MFGQGNAKEDNRAAKLVKDFLFSLRLIREHLAGI
jgi:hypothetical protein